MNKEQLYRYLDIETPEDFEYFENIAALLECGEDISYEEMYGLLKDIDKDTLAMLIDNYFEEISDFIPSGAAELYILMDKIRLSLIGLAKKSGEENIMANLAEELNRFRAWYSADSGVICREISEGRELSETLRDALALARLENLDGDKFDYDFSACMDYKLDEYTMSFGDMIAAAEREE